MRCDDDDGDGDDGGGFGGDAGDGRGQEAFLTSHTGLVGSRAIWCTFGTLQNLFCSC